MPAPNPAPPARGLSKETSAFLDSLLRDKNLSLRMREDIKKGMATGEDWAAQLSTRKASHVAATSARPRPRGQPSRRRTTALPAEGASLAAMPARTGIRTRDQILADTGNYSVERFAGTGVGPNRDAEKGRLARVNEMGREAAGWLEAARLAGRGAVAGPGPGARGESDVREELMDQIAEEIRGRREFYEQMQAAGREKENRHLLGEISSRLAEMRRLQGAG